MVSRKTPQQRAIDRALDKLGDLDDEIAPFIAGPRPNSPIEGHYHDYLRWACDSWAQVPAWARAASQVAGVQWMGVDEVMGRACTPYLGDGAPAPVPPFTGGQCPGVWYDIAFVNNRTGQTVRPAALPGPILGYSTYPGPNFWTLRVVYGAGSIYEFRYDSVVNGTVTISGFTATRQDGQPDTCGNPRPKEPTPSPTRPPDPGPPPGGGQPPYVEPDGRWRFPVGPIPSPYDEPDYPVEPVEPDPDPPEEPPPGEPGQPGLPAPTGEGGEVEGDAPEGQEISSLVLALTVVPDGRAVYKPDIHRGAAWIWMGDDAGLSQLPDGALLRPEQSVFPPRGGLTRWRVRANWGYDVLVTPYYREVD